MLAALRLIASVIPGSAFWGFDFLRYMPLPAALAITITAIVAALDRKAVLAKPLEAVAEFLFRQSVIKRLAVFSACSIAIMAVFSLFAVPYPFLGDGKHVVTALYRIFKGDEQAQAVLWNEPLSHLYYLYTLKWLFPELLTSRVVDLKGVFAIFKWTSYVIGGLYLFALLSLSGNLAKNKLERLALVAGILGCGGILIFFGYVEYYAFLYFFGTLFLLTGVGEAKRSSTPVRSGALLALAIAFHLSAVVFLPAYFFLLYAWIQKRSGKPEPSLRLIIRIVMAVLICCLALYLILEIMGIGGFFIPLLPGKSAWALLSVQHALDILNNVLLHAPFAAAVVAAIALTKTRPRIDNQFLFAAIATVFWFALIVAHSAIARDWDVYALSGVSFTVAAFYLIGTFNDAGVRRYYLAQMTVQSLLLIIPWIWVNGNTAASEQRFADVTEQYSRILPVDVTSGCFETLREYNSNRKRRRNELYYQGRILDINPSPYEYYKLARTVNYCDELSQGELALVDRSMNDILSAEDSVRYAPVGTVSKSKTTTLDDVYQLLMVSRVIETPDRERIPWLTASLDRYLASGGRRFTAGLTGGKILASLGAGKEALHWLRLALADTAHAADSGRMTVSKLYAALALTQLNAEKKDTAMHYFRLAAVHPSVDAEVLADYAYAAFLFGDPAESIAASRRTLALEPQNMNALYCLGALLVRKPETAKEGINVLRTYLQYYPSAKNAGEIRQLIGTAGKAAETE